MTANAQLQTVYDKVYRNGAESFYTIDNWEESLLIHRFGGPWQGRRVLEIGCGLGRLSALLALSGADVTAVDYSDEALQMARKQFDLPHLTFSDAAPHEAFDVVVMQGTLEHMDDWREYLVQLVERHSPQRIVTSSPSFLNPRGYVWQTLRLLFDVPMSLTDVHFICPSDMMSMCREQGWDVDYRSCHHDWAGGRTMLADYAKRLPNALRDADMDASRVPQLLEWLEQNLDYYTPDAWSGANVCYSINIS